MNSNRTAKVIWLKTHAERHWKNDVESIVKSPANYEELCKLAIAYSDGVIQNSEKVNENVMKFARESGVPVLDYQPADTYVDAFNEFYDKVWEFEKK